MGYEGSGTGGRAEKFWGTSEHSLDDAIQAAVGAMPEDTPEGTRLVLERIEVTTKGDPHIGSYMVLLGTGG